LKNLDTAAATIEQTMEKDFDRLIQVILTRKKVLQEQLVTLKEKRQKTLEGKINVLDRNLHHLEQSMSNLVASTSELTSSVTCSAKVTEVTTDVPLEHETIPQNDTIIQSLAVSSRLLMFEQQHQKDISIVQSELAISDLSDITDELVTINSSPNNQWNWILDHQLIYQFNDAGMIEGNKLYQELLLPPPSNKPITLDQYINGIRMEQIRLSEKKVKQSTILFISKTSVATAGTDGMIWFWDISTGWCIDLIDNSIAGSIKCLIKTSDTKKLISGSSNKSIHVWDLGTKTSISEWKCDSEISCLTVYNNNQFLACGLMNDHVMIWNLATIESVAVFQGHGIAITAISVSSNNQFLASGASDGTIQLWNLTTKESISLVEGHRSKLKSVLFSKDNKILYSASELGGISIWNGENLEFLVNPSQEGVVKITSAVTFPHGNVLLVGGGYGHIHAWDITNDVYNYRDQVAIYTCQTSNLTDCQFVLSEDGMVIVEMGNYVDAYSKIRPCFRVFRSAENQI
jgi:WD40 repeat protein